MNLNNIKYNLKRYTIDAVKASILCIRFPFLYPRNRFSGLHYNNWRVKDCCSKLVEKYKYHGKQDPGSKKVYNLKVDKYETLGTYYTYWTNWWAGILYNIITWYHDVFLQILHCIPTYTELDAMPKGWRKAFGIQMCKEIKYYLKKKGLLRTYRVLQVKEKYGCLEWYDSYTCAEVQKVINKYQYISKYTCCICGELATASTPIEYWASPYCDKCFPSNSKYRLTYGMKDNGWYGWTGNINGYSEEKYNELKKNYEEYMNLHV